MSKTRQNTKVRLWGLCLVGLCVLTSGQTAMGQQEEVNTRRGVMYYDYVDEHGVLRGGVIEVEAERVEGRGRLLLDAWNVETIVDNGPTTNRVDLVFVGDGYQESELGVYAADVSNIVDGLFEELPLDEYASFFNVHRVDVISTDSGVDHDRVFPTWRDTALNMGFWTGGIERALGWTPEEDKELALEAADLAPDSDQVMAVANSSWSGGAGYMRDNLATVAGHDESGGTNETALHEFGHTLAKLEDEYFGDWNYWGPEPANGNVTIYNEQGLRDRETKWYRWLDEENVGVEHGAMRIYFFGIFRPTEWSKMRALWEPFYQVNVEQFVLKIYEIVNPIDDATPPGTYPGSAVFFVEPMQPATHDLDVQWYLDADPIPGATGTTLDVAPLDLSSGTYTLSVEVIDNTELVRDEGLRADLMSETREWTLHLESLPECHEDYDEWVLMGRPGCWAWPYQCDGDADGKTETILNFRIFGRDLNLVVENWKRTVDDPLLNRCADIDHEAETVFKYRVYGNDLDIVVANWKKKDGDLAGNCAECDRGQQAQAGGELSFEELLKWLAEIWLDPEVRKVIDEDAWLKFVESLRQDIESPPVDSQQ
jgi:hypothetical protein